MKSRSARFAIYRKKSGAVLIAVQIAVTLAILSNALGLIVDRLSWSARLTGIDEANIFFIYATSVDKPPSFAALESSDLAVAALHGRRRERVCDQFLSSRRRRLVDDCRSGAGPEDALGAYFLLFWRRAGAGHARCQARLPDAISPPPKFSIETASSAPPATGIIITRALAQRLFPRWGRLGSNRSTPKPRIRRPLSASSIDCKGRLSPRPDL